MSDATTPAVVQDAQQYDWREDYLHNIPWCPALDRLVAHVEGLEARSILSVAYIERLEAERDALLAEHEAVAIGRDELALTEYPYEPAIVAAHDNAERVIHGE